MRVGSKKTGGTIKGSGSKPSTKNSGKEQVSLKSLGETTSSLTADSVEVSDHTTAIQVIKDLVNGTPDIRAHEVERVSKMLKNGQYKFDLEKVAEAFIRETIVSELARKSGKKGL
jgi:flagellar biosynthesis anti-sigma factor FlgM